MDCSLVREALSARIDGEREPVPPKWVDEHLETCAECQVWSRRAVDHAQRLRDLAHAGGLRRLPSQIDSAPLGVSRSSRFVFPRLVIWARCSLALVGVVSLVLAVMQMMSRPSQRSDALGIHLFGESSAWSIAVGTAMILAGASPAAAAGLVGVLGTYSVVLTVYVVIDAANGVISPVRELGHIPVLVGAVLALLVWRGTRSPGPAPLGTGALEPARASAGSSQPMRSAPIRFRNSPRGGSAA
ncbi:zf-HC2 domain-containing protein (plasmid) [Mycolicibacterium fluoranthenivorans]|uniref:Zf-HC2 domain-containing protein n=1 Tax=Mycolicibacterium fluoranthenivorans TaxID=258505 RepID=A0A7G8PQC0_9MYCO|nr:zf-HC2 domain-containing protein [Mycolicibacterium fluoranthenivorans]QNJ96536.1 zf-HC2 domain-containing protein [Mycolicibacterium fluoranthenivorans]